MFPKYVGALLPLVSNVLAIKLAFECTMSSHWFRWLSSGVWIRSQQWWVKYGVILIMLTDLCEFEGALLAFAMGLIDFSPTYWSSKRILLSSLHLPILIGIVAKLFARCRPGKPSESTRSLTMKMNDLQARPEQVRSTLPETLNPNSAQLDWDSLTSQVYLTLLFVLTFAFSSLLNLAFVSGELLEMFLERSDILSSQDLDLLFKIIVFTPFLVVPLGILVIALRPRKAWPLIAAHLIVLVAGVSQYFPRLFQNVWHCCLFWSANSFVYLLIPFALFFVQQRLRAPFKVWQMFILAQAYNMGKELIWIILILTNYRTYKRKASFVLSIEVFGILGLLLVLCALIAMKKRY